MASARISCVVNGQETTFESDPERSLLEVLREDLSLTGTKYGCGDGACGACTVIIDGKRALSCLTRSGEVGNQRIITIEGLSPDGTLHPVQQAFLDSGAFQCGYCTAGMIMSAVVLLEEKPQATDSEVGEWMNPNLCRCCGYANQLAAVHDALGASRQEVTR